MFSSFFCQPLSWNCHKCEKFPVFSLLNREFSPREWFASDCVIRQAVGDLRHSPEKPAKFACVRRFPQSSRHRRGHDTGRFEPILRISLGGEALKAEPTESHLMMEGEPLLHRGQFRLWFFSRHTEVACSKKWHDSDAQRAARIFDLSGSHASLYRANMPTPKHACLLSAH